MIFAPANTAERAAAGPTKPRTANILGAQTAFFHKLFLSRAGRDHQGGGNRSTKAYDESDSEAVVYLPRVHGFRAACSTCSLCSSSSSGCSRSLFSVDAGQFDVLNLASLPAEL